MIIKLASDGSEKRYVYAYRGGPRVAVDLDHPSFDTERERAIEEHRKAAAGAVARTRIKGETSEFEQGGDIGGSLRELAHKMVRSARHRAVRRKIPCAITVGDVIELLRSQGMKCAVSGLPLDSAYNVERVHARNMYGPSIDRIKNKLGYERTNIRIVISAVNYAINEWGIDEYIKICRAVATRNPEEM